MTSRPVFDLLNSPLKGRNLLEASAGTGKTFTIAALYLRLLLQQGLTVDRILVVTFTEAATEELRERIRLRIHEALQTLSNPPGNDPFLISLFENFQSSGDRQRAKSRLREALICFDEAAIYTIHGFCQRILQDKAFEAGSLFDTELVTDQSLLIAEIAQDYWRQHCTRVSEGFARYLIDNKVVPSSFIKQISQAVSDPGILIFPDLCEPDLTPLEKAWELARDQLRACWSQHGQEIRALLTSFDAFKHSLGNPVKLAALISEVDLYLGGDIHTPPPENLFKFFTPDGLQKYTTIRQVPPQHKFFEFCKAAETSRIPLDAAYQVKLLALQLGFIRNLHRQLSERKKARNIRHFDDLLLDVRNRLTGTAGPRLCQAIRTQFGAAFIDEFQDTDPVQFEIFQNLYPDALRPIFFIGDPKQAIYSFRGADIFAYIAATHTVESIYTLGTNWRSTPALVKAINTLFAAHDNPFVFTEIGFQPVAHKHQAPLDLLIIDGNDNDPPLRFWSCEPLNPDKKEDNLDISRHRMATAVATEISRLLNLASANQATVNGRCLKAGDMAVLVYTHTQASLVQRVLKEHGIPGVQSGTGSLFKTREVREVLRVLQALADPVDESRLKAALATDLFGCSGTEIGQLTEDESQLELWLDKFLHYNRLWHERGLIAMSGELLSKERVRQRLLGLSDGPRRLTNLLHCFEILHKAATEHHFGCDGLIKWFSKQFEETRENEEYQIRLETDDNAVQIVTIHKSKGLEYPIVFSPFNWNQPTGGNNAALFHHPDHQLRRAIDLGGPDIETHHQLADRERHAEQMRLLYVALTRARYRCYVGWGVLKGGEKSALGYLLHASRQGTAPPDYDPPDKIDSEQIQATFETLNEQSSGTILLSDLPEEVAAELAPQRKEVTELVEQTFSGQIDRSWAISSFTSLTAAHDHNPQTASDQTLVIRDQADLPESNPGNDFDAFIDFPRGALAGSCLHQLFEDLDFHRERAIPVEQTATEALNAFAFDLNWTDPVAKMVHKTLTTPLTCPEGSRFCLEQIPPVQCLAEMEFHLPLASIDPQGLSRVFSQHDGGPKLAVFADRLASLGFSRHHGMLHGFIDLIFRHKDRYYLVDWKSNYLGSQPEDYTPEALAVAMMANDYTLQYHLYLAALHRYLENHLCDYDYTRHFGGVYYIFLRGTAYNETKTTLGIHYDWPELGLVTALSNYLQTGKEAA
ncbi:MAG: exodeoxyribonuclease V subunit beta [Desulfuromonas sp.]|nr:MAG: exodeoxyribonuclease V subunit beta [Desulfuromonas sp.]